MAEYWIGGWIPVYLDTILRYNLARWIQDTLDQAPGLANFFLDQPCLYPDTDNTFQGIRRVELKDGRNKTPPSFTHLGW